eukprot:GDKJ01015309.1.p1 GENE.GDKJ01015309.1~~GDKJ01015309.1.p1  ORF type:complete len:1203 (+),score=342.30 GDKJ01015309.1:3-3611(+)
MGTTQMSYTIENVSEAFKWSLSEEKALRDQAEVFFKQASTDFNFAVLLLKIINGDFGVVADQIAKQTGVWVKNAIGRQRSFLENAEFRRLLCDTSLKCSASIRPHLGYILIRYMVKEHLETFRYVAERFVAACAANDSVVIANSLYLISKIASYLAVQSGPKRAGFHPYEVAIFDKSMELVSRLVESAGGMVQALCNNAMAEIIYLVMRSIEHLTHFHFSESAVNTPDRVQKVIELCGSIISAPLPLENPAHVKKNKAFWARAKKWSLVFTSSSFSRLTDRKRAQREKEIRDRIRRIQLRTAELDKARQSPDSAKIAELEKELEVDRRVLTMYNLDKEIINNVLRPSLTHFVSWILPLAVDPSKPIADRKHKWISESQIARVFFILSNAVCNKDLHAAFKEYLEALMLQVALPYLDWSWENSEDCDNDPIGFIEVDLPREEPSTVAVSAARVLIMEATRAMKESFYPLLRAIQARCQIQTLTTEQAVKECAGALLCFHDIANAFTSAHFKQVPLDTFLVDVVCPLTAHASPIVAYRACACLMSYRSVLDKRKTPVNVTLKLLEALTTATLQNPNRLVCSAAVTSLSDMIGIAPSSSSNEEDDLEDNSHSSSSKKDKHAVKVTEAARNHLAPFAGQIVAKLLKLSDGNRSENLFKSMTLLSNAFPDAVAQSATEILTILSVALDKIDKEGDEDEDKAFNQTHELFEAASNIIKTVISRRSANTPLEINFQLAVRRLAKFAVRNDNDNIAEEASLLYSMLVVVGDSMQAVTMNIPMERVPSLSPVQWGVLTDIHLLITKKTIYEVYDALFEAVRQICFNSVRECLVQPVEGIHDSHTGENLVGYKAIVNVAIAMRDVSAHESMNHIMSHLVIGYLFEGLMMAGNGCVHEQAKQVLQLFPFHVFVLLNGWYVQQVENTKRHHQILKDHGFESGRVDINDEAYGTVRKLCIENPKGFESDAPCLEALGFAMSAALAFHPEAVMSGLVDLDEEKAAQMLQHYSLTIVKFKTIRSSRMFIFAMTKIMESMSAGRLTRLPKCWESHLPNLFELFPSAATTLNKLRVRSLDMDDDGSDGGYFNDSDEDDWDREWNDNEVDESEERVVKETTSLLDKLKEAASKDDEEEDDDEDYDEYDYLGLGEDRQDLMDTINVIDHLLNGVLAKVEPSVQAKLVECLGGAEFLKMALETEFEVRKKENAYIEKMDEVV